MHVIRPLVAVSPDSKRGALASLQPLPCQGMSFFLHGVAVWLVANEAPF